MRRVALLLLLLLAGGCTISGKWIRVSVEEPVPPASTDGLSPGVSSMQACLDRLGAPVLLWECPKGAIALAWPWQDEASWNISAGWAFRTGVTPSYKWYSISVDVPAVVLVFDEQMKLQQIRSGTFGEIAQEMARKKRPDAIDEG